MEHNLVDKPSQIKEKERQKQLAAEEKKQRKKERDEKGAMRKQEQKQKAEEKARKAKEVAEKKVKKVVEKTTRKAAEKKAKKVVEKTTRKAAEKTTRKAAEKTTRKAADRKAAEKTTRKAVEKTNFTPNIGEAGPSSESSDEPVPKKRRMTNSDIEEELCCMCFGSYSDVLEQSGKDWIWCACGRWLHNNCAEDHRVDQSGQDRFCYSCLDLLG